MNGCSVKNNMHREIFTLFEDFKAEFLKDSKCISILEVGSKLSQSRRLLNNFCESSWDWIGLDIIPGRNVDIVSDNPYNYPLEDSSFDVVISSNTLEHVQDMSSWVKELARITKDLVWVVAPNAYEEHGKDDYWRIMPRGMEYLLSDVAGLKIIKVEKSKYKPADTVGIARKYV